MKRQQLAAALDVDERTLRAYFARGLPKPSPRESLRHWADRAWRWKAHNRRRPGPKPGPFSETREHLEVKLLQLRIEKLSHELKRARRDLCRRADAEAEIRRDAATVIAAFASFGADLAQRCHREASVYEIQEIVDEEIRRRLTALADAAGELVEVPADDAANHVPAGDSAPASSPGPDAGDAGARPPDLAG